MGKNKGKTTKQQLTAADMEKASPVSALQGRKRKLTDSQDAISPKSPKQVKKSLSGIAAKLAQKSPSQHSNVSPQQQNQAKSPNSQTPMSQKKNKRKKAAVNDQTQQNGGSSQASPNKNGTPSLASLKNTPVQSPKTTPKQGNTPKQNKNATPKQNNTPKQNKNVTPKQPNTPKPSTGLTPKQGNTPKQNKNATPKQNNTPKQNTGPTPKQNNTPNQNFISKQSKKQKKAQQENQTSPTTEATNKSPSQQTVASPNPKKGKKSALKGETVAAVVSPTQAVRATVKKELSEDFKKQLEEERQQMKQRNARKLFVSPLPSDAVAADLSPLLEGTVAVSVKQRRNGNKKQRGVAFIEFKSEALADQYKKSLVGKEVKGCKITTVDYMGEKSENKKSQRVALSSESPAQGEVDTLKLYIGNVAKDADEDELKKLFPTAASVNTGTKSRGFVFADYSTEDACRAAHVKLQGQALGASTLTVQFAKARLTKKQIIEQKKQNKKERVAKAKARKKETKQAEYEAKLKLEEEEEDDAPPAKKAKLMKDSKKVKEAMAGQEESDSSEDASDEDGDEFPFQNMIRSRDGDDDDSDDDDSEEESSMEEDEDEDDDEDDSSEEEDDDDDDDDSSEDDEDVRGKLLRLFAAAAEDDDEDDESSEEDDGENLYSLVEADEDSDEDDDEDDDDDEDEDDEDDDDDDMDVEDADSDDISD